MRVTIDKFGRVLIPKVIRDQLGIEPGTELALHVGDGGDVAPSIVLRPEETQPPFERQGNVLVFIGRLTEEIDWQNVVRKQREQRDRRVRGID